MKEETKQEVDLELGQPRTSAAAQLPGEISAVPPPVPNVARAAQPGEAVSRPASQTSTDAIYAGDPNKDKTAKRIKAGREKRAGKKKFTTAQRIAEANHPNNPAAADALTAQYRSRFTELDGHVTDDIHSERSFKLDLVKPELISIPYLERYFKTVVGNYTEFNRKGVEDGYTREPKKWLESAHNRGRLVLVEAKENNLKDIANAMVNASPLERVVPVGLDEAKQHELKEDLLVALELKIQAQDNPTEYRANLMQAFREEYDKPEATRLNQFELDELMGPHGFSEAKDISFANLQTSLESSFSTKVDEIILYGSDSSLAMELPILSREASSEQFLAIKSSEFETGESPYWTARFVDQENPLELMVSSKHPQDILVEANDGMNLERAQKTIGDRIKDVIWPGFDLEVIPATEKNFELNPSFEEVFESAKDKGLSDEDVAYLKDIFVGNSLFAPNLSSDLYSATVTKTQSGINGEGAVVVGNALREGNIGRQVATAKGVLFAVNATMFDTANDINLENKDKRQSYKHMFVEMLIQNAKDPSKSPSEVYKSAMSDVINAYAFIEKQKKIKFYSQLGDLYRLYTLENADKTNKRNRIGINLLLPLPLGVGYGASATVAGMTLAATGGSASIAFPIAGVASFASFTTILATSLEYQRKANADNLARWHRASARAFGSNKIAFDEVKKLQNDIIGLKKQSGGLRPVEELVREMERVIPVSPLVEEALAVLENPAVAQQTQEATQGTQSQDPLWRAAVAAAPEIEEVVSEKKQQRDNFGLEADSQIVSRNVPSIGIAVAEDLGPSVDLEAGLARSVGSESKEEEVELTEVKTEKQAAQSSSAAEVATNPSASAEAQTESTSNRQDLSALAFSAGTSTGRSASAERKPKAKTLNRQVTM